MATVVSSSPSSLFPGSFGSHSSFGGPPNYYALLNHFLNSAAHAQHLLETQVQDSRGREVDLAMDLAQYHGPRVHSHRNRRSAEGYGDGYGYEEDYDGDDYHDDDYDVSPFFNIPKFYAHYDRHNNYSPYGAVPYGQSYGYGGGYGHGYGGGHSYGGGYGYRRKYGYGHGGYGGGYNTYKPRYGGHYYSPYATHVGGYKPKHY